MQAFAVLFLLPIAIGLAAERIFRDTRNASLLATLATPAAIYCCIELLDPEGTWNGLATFLFAPLAIALALATVLIAVGHAQARATAARRGPRALPLPEASQRG